ncbi:DoxX family protein [Pedococcus sp. 5OH_020]|uniref:DoxX family protein n=1 Tax=Pedococcus sp. 5OH_020 TaxID=2989814 RepID=UPI0022E9E53F|nr:DoxX family protein [Pedococcus sp. 5OH_020]
MTLVRRVARPMLAAIFVVQGLEQLRHPGALADKVEPLARKVAPLGLPDDPELLVRANGATMVGGGALLATGHLPRLASLALAGSIIPTTYVGHPFWAETDPTMKRVQRIGFLKNVGLLGGLLLAAVDTEGRPGLAYRAGMAGDSAKRAAQRARREARYAARSARREAKLAATQAHDALT